MAWCARSEILLAVGCVAVLGKRGGQGNAGRKHGYHELVHCRPALPQERRYLSSAAAARIKTTTTNNHKNPMPPHHSRHHIVHHGSPHLAGFGRSLHTLSGSKGW